MLTQVDSGGMSTSLMEAIVDHQRDEAKAFQHQDKYVRTKNGRKPQEDHKRLGATHQVQGQI